MRTASRRFALRVARMFRRPATRWARAGRGNFALVVHRGRRSGRPYETPVQAVPIDGGFVVSLPYGADVHWLQNIRAAGECELITRGSTFAVERISVVAAQRRGASPRRHAQRNAAVILHTPTVPVGDRRTEP
ncbi:hypothetical protein ARHIZOSPH14_13670 [Agromyces rhizosphaerae]|uniref:Nitroreductase family deazaflavin-dependent oxidoreductase n=1 Tax=Agromyces rhizosphaerae TaxID=88374 RepID=A0A9W6CWU1_9MICO|nr:nitroreductase family deazaflavin-dependent oxidoreductase [Agromyces rhizosphaerae]GLI27125.1 hypothetical protein ARHIZOSPH14_13670 [Agromyces rhizosphaerae]